MGMGGRGTEMSEGVGGAGVSASNSVIVEALREVLGGSAQQLVMDRFFYSAIICSRADSLRSHVILHE